ncbi:MAG: DNA adenine methylase [Rikenellaceae bacterium]
MKNSKPFVKWVGGKTQLIKDITNYLPANFAEIKNLTYIEPFVGGGAVLFWILQNYPNIERAVINDINPNLTCTYQTIKDEPHKLIEFLSNIEEKYFNLNSEIERKEYFLAQREKFNYNCENKIERAGLFIFLNRTCFNGLYRVNKKGHFNVPFGRYANPKICDKQTILADSELLQKVTILTGDFSQTLNHVGTNNFFYFDPPYKPITKTSSFTTYTKEDFGDKDQLRLGSFCEKVTQLGYTFLLSNSDLKNSDPTDNFFDNLYKNFNIKRINASRMINSNATKRGKISELLVSNTTPKSLNYEGAL